jgi:hypothetical protein
MKKDNLTFLQENLRYLGFGEGLPLNDQLVQEVEKGEKEFQLRTEAHFDEWSKIEAVLYFKKGGEQDMYFFSKYTAALLYPETPDHDKAHTFYIFKGSGVTLKEAFNLLQGRAVNKDLTDSDGEKYNAWIQLDFRERTASSNYKVRQYRVQYGYDLEKVLHSYPIRELQVEELRLNLIRSLKKGNIHPVTFEKTSKIEKMYIEACPQFKSVSIYSQTVRAAQRSALQSQQRMKGVETLSTLGMRSFPGDKQEEGEIEKEEEGILPPEEQMQTDGPTVRKRSRRSA